MGKSVDNKNIPYLIEKEIKTFAYRVVILH